MQSVVLLCMCWSEQRYFPTGLDIQSNQVNADVSKSQTFASLNLNPTNTNTPYLCTYAVRNK